MNKSIKRRINPVWQYIPRLCEIGANDLNTMAISSLQDKWILWKTCRVCVYSLQKVNVLWWLRVLCEVWLKLCSKRQSQHGHNRMFPWSEVNFLLMLVCFLAESLIKSLLRTKSVLCKCTSNLTEARVSILSQAWYQGHNLKPSPQL